MCRDFKSAGVGTGCVVDADLLNKDESNTEGSGNSRLCQFILSGLKTPHNIQLLNFFLHSIHGFRLVWKMKLFEADMTRNREEVFTYGPFLSRRVA